MCVDVDRILGKSWWPDVCHLSQGAHTPYTRGIPWVRSPERVRLTGGRACWTERGHSYRSIFLIGNFRRRLARELLV